MPTLPPVTKRAPRNNIEELQDQKTEALDLETLHNSPGGQLLIRGLISDIVGAVETLSNKVHELEMQQFITLSCKIKERLDIIRALTGARANRDILDGLLKEELAKQPEAPRASEESEQE